MKVELIGELNEIIPSETVRKYIKETGWTFTDFQLASILFHGDFPWKKEHSMLQKLKDYTDDAKLKKQLTAYLDWGVQVFDAFKENKDENHIYVLKTKDEDTEEADFDDIQPYGYFFDWEMAFAYGREENFSFLIEKHIVARDKSVLPRLENTGYGYINDEAAWICFDKDGEALSFSSREIPCDDKDEDFYTHFKSAFYEVPNPFERGDIVRIVESEDYGIVENSQKDWKDFLQKRKSPEWRQKGHNTDYTDVQLRVVFPNEDGVFCHAHINPLYLERYQPEKDMSGSALDCLLLYASEIYHGKGSLDDLYYFMVKYQNAGKKI